MPRCCGGAECACVITEGTNTSVTGTGTIDDPYVITSDFDSQAALDAHINNPTGAHAASAISYAGSTGLSADDVEEALDELDTEKAPIASPTLTGDPKSATPAAGDNDTSIATSAFVQGEFNAHNPTAILTATEANSTVTLATLTGHTFTIPAGKTLRLTGLLTFRSAATTTGAIYGLKVTQPSGASGNAQGSVVLDMPISGAAVATGLRLGDNYDVAANSNATVSITGTDVSSTSVDHVAQLTAIIKNRAAAHSTTVEVQFASEVAASAITAQIGTAAFGVIN